MTTEKSPSSTPSLEELRGGNLDENQWELLSRKRGHPAGTVTAKCHHCQEQ